jgi:5,6-dimethylbenzimidazole synthase
MVFQEKMMRYEDLLSLVQKRRSIRKFKADPVPDDYIHKIIEAASWAPSGANSQPWQFVVVKKPDLQNQIMEYIIEQNRLMFKIEEAREPEQRFMAVPAGWKNAPSFILVIGDPRLKEAYPAYVTFMRGEQTFISSLASSFLYMTLAVTSLGLGGQWVSGVAGVYAQAQTKKLLGIPQQMTVYDMLAIGYPDMEPKPRMKREMKDMVHFDNYDPSKYASDEQVKEFIATKLRKGFPR